MTPREISQGGRSASCGAGTRASSGHRELQENELGPELSKHFKWFSRCEVNDTVSFHVCFRDADARGGAGGAAVRSFSRPEAAMEFMRSELPSLTGAAARLAAKCGSCLLSVLDSQLLYFSTWADTQLLAGDPPRGGRGGSSRVVSSLPLLLCRTA